MYITFLRQSNLDQIISLLLLRISTGFPLHSTFRIQSKPFILGNKALTYSLVSPFFHHNVSSMMKEKLICFIHQYTPKN